ncbi:serine hydrolase [Actinophytocola xinjiangensis]|uniref:Serine hydrolase n=1 Tax=Actinophytocola xinjiangensis TaxID=485602 RepID=A0A7Z0WGG1_9PSEU|nr:serine hydrolase domain-containing protein [Actinophytocola xinjiangensis]OLF06174.1 serine hydrolase [Actinophytocola xinjiangensis]
MRATLATLLLTAGLLTATPAVNAAAQADHPLTQQALDQYLPHAGPGAAVLAGDENGPWTVTSGSATSPASRPIAPQDHFRAASQTKTFTSVMVLQLVDEGLVELDAPIETYLPGVVAGNGYDGNAISVRQILNHTSGIARDPRNPAANADGGYDLAELVRSGLTQAPLFPPGTDFAYSNVGYQTLGLLVERLTGQTYQQAVTARIITPLGLDDTSYPSSGDRTLAEPFLRGYLGGRLGPVFFWYDNTFSLEPTLIGSAGAMNSTMPDLVTLHQALAAGDLVSPASLAQMRQTSAHQPDYGLGLMSWELSCGGTAWGHPGDLTTGHTSVTMVTDDGRFASLVTNTFVNNTAEPTRGDVIDAALCES